MCYDSLCHRYRAQCMCQLSVRAAIDHPTPHMLTNGMLQGQGINKVTKLSIAQLNRKVAHVRARAEKAAMIADSNNQHVFKVLPGASKEEVKNAVEQMFNVKVETVRTVNVIGKQKRFGRTLGKRSDWKKAYVRLAEGHDIDLSGME